MKKTRRYFYTIWRNSCQYFAKAGVWGLAEQGLAILRALVALAEIVLTQQLFDLVAARRSFPAIAMSLLSLTAVLLSQQILEGLGRYWLSQVSYTNMGKFMVDFQKKLGRLPAVSFEDPHFLDQVEKAKECLEYESLGHFASICLQVITYYTVYLCGLGAYLSKVSPSLMAIFLLAFLPALVAQGLKARYFVDLEEDLAPERRRCKAYKDSLINRKFFKETRMLGAYHYFYQRFSESLLWMTHKRWQVEKKLALLQLAFNGLTFIGFAGALYLLFTQLMERSISVGMFGALFVALSEVFSLIDELVSTHLASGSEIIGQVANFYQLMDLEEVPERQETPNFSKGIVAKDLSFSYPRSDRHSLSELSLTLEPKETLAIVGENGSGKSTLVKVLTGLYGPSEGNLSLGGVDLSRQALGRSYQAISGVFQHFQRYKLTLGENVAISDWAEKEDREKIQDRLKEADFSTPHATLETNLAPEFGGLDLSGGQWQRVAIARGLFRASDLMVLDEPTAAIDPIEEAKLYRQFKALVENRTAVIVTHRLGSTQFADRIVVMDQGKIAEIGRHEELMEGNGKYRAVWEAQAHWYRASKEELG